MCLWYPARRRYLLQARLPLPLVLLPQLGRLLLLRRLLGPLRLPLALLRQPHQLLVLPLLLREEEQRKRGKKKEVNAETDGGGDVLQK